MWCDVGIEYSTGKSTENGAGVTGYSYAKRILSLYSSIYKQNPLWIKDQIMKGKTFKLLEGNLGHYLYKIDNFNRNRKNL